MDLGKDEDELTFEYHFKACSGRLYCLAFSSRSLTSLGKTVSKSFNLLDEGLEVGIGASLFVTSCEF